MEGVLTLFGVMMAIFIPITMMIFVTEHFKNKKVTRKQIAAIQDQLLEAGNEELEQEIAQLKDRIAVLESIVTDKRYDLDRKIANL